MIEFRRSLGMLDRAYYHATYLSDAEEIMQQGFRIERARNRGRILGPAVYVTADRRFALGYADDIREEEGEDAGMLVLNLKVTKFLSVLPTRWPQTVREKYWSRTHQVAPVDYPLLGEIARELGYQAVGNALGNVAVYEPNLIQVIKLERLYA